MALIIAPFVALGIMADEPIVSREAGLYESPKSKCVAILKASDKGGFLRLFIGHDESSSRLIANDVNGIAWTPSGVLYSVSPVYGKPGIFIVACNGTITTLVGPTHLDNKAYPDGADFFELHSVSSRTFDYYYAPVVDKIEFTTFRSPENLRTGNLPRPKKIS